MIDCNPSKLLSNPASLGQFKHHKTSAHDNRPNPWTWNISNFQRVIPNKQTSSSSSSTTTTTAATATWLMMNSSSFFALHPSLKDQSSLKRVAHALKIHHNHPSAVTANLAPMDIPHMAAWCWHYVTTDKTNWYVSFKTPKVPVGANLSLRVFPLRCPPLKNAFDQRNSIMKTPLSMSLQFASTSAMMALKKCKQIHVFYHIPLDSPRLFCPHSLWILPSWCLDQTIIRILLQIP